MALCWNLHQVSRINARTISCRSAHSYFRWFINKAIIFVLNVMYQISNQNRFNNNEICSFPNSTPQTNMRTTPLVKGFLMLCPFLFQQTKPPSSRMQEHVLATYHPLAKLCISGCWYLKNKSIQPLGLGREHVRRGMYFISGIFCDLREYAGNRKM